MTCKHEPLGGPVEVSGGADAIIGKSTVCTAVCRHCGQVFIAALFSTPGGGSFKFQGVFSPTGDRGGSQARGVDAPRGVETLSQDETVERGRGDPTNTKVTTLKQGTLGGSQPDSGERPAPKDPEDT